MWKVIKKRLLLAVPTLIGVSLVAFLLVRVAPGDPVMLLLGEQGSDPEVVRSMKASLGLNRSYFEQYFIFLKNIIQFDFGNSIVSSRSVWEEFRESFAATLELSILSLLWAILLGIPIGIFAAIKRGSLWDRILMGGSLVGYSLPVFYLGLIFILFFSVKWGLTPVSGRIDAWFDIPQVTNFLLIDVFFSQEKWLGFLSALKHLALPVLTLGTIPLAALSRMTRTCLLEVIQENYIRTARSKGAGEFRVYFVHALKNAFLPVLTLTGSLFGTLLTGAILTETVFSWPGLGRWFVAAVESRDYPVIQGGIVLISVVVIFVNLSIDVLYLWVNPKLRETQQ